MAWTDWKLRPAVLAIIAGLVLLGTSAVVAVEPASPAAEAASPAADAASPEFGQFERSHWSLRPRVSVVPPQPSNDAARDWALTPVDPWIWGRLEQAKLAPAQPAEPAVLLRRVTLDLTGLPPTLDEIEAFIGDAGPDAYERLVDRLLASPRHGERMAQHWLDVVRFAETEGFEYDQHRPGAWRYRDYVVDSLNRDLPFDRFLTEQLAGDELDEPDQAALVAVGFHRLGPIRRNAGNSDVSFSRNEVLTEMTDAVGTVFLGLTIHCARCHDHKFDPIRQVDYYRLQAYLAATDEYDIPIAPPDTVQRWQEESQRIKDELKQLREAMQEALGQERDKLAEKYKQLEASQPAPLPTVSSMRNEARRTASVQLLERGQTDRPKFAVGPRVPSIFLPVNSTGVPELAPDVARPKSRLAQWLLEPNHPLTSRVLANRVWQWHFGSGLVATPNDFGMNGAAPSHPELLDDLANRLVAGWQLKPLHRLLVTSRSYRQSSQATVAMSAAAEPVDPDNRWLWRFPRRRLEAEALRDTLLAVSGQIDLTAGGPSIIVPVEQELVDLLYKPDQWEVTPGPAARHRRSVYLIAKRNLRLPLLELFDQPDLQTSCGRRPASTHAPQALELLNGSFANDMADALADRLARESPSSTADRIDRAFRLATGHGPTAGQRQFAEEFLARSAPREFALAILNLNSLLYVD